MQDRNGPHFGASLGMAVREFSTTAGPADYLLFAGRKTIGVAEAKPADTTELVVCYNPDNWHDRMPTWAESNAAGRGRSYSYDELIARDKVSLATSPQRTAPAYWSPKFWRPRLSLISRPLLSSSPSSRRS